LFDWLWPIALGAAHSRLALTYPEEAEDVAITSLEQLPAKLASVKSAEDLSRLVRTIAKRRAVSRWRELTAEKRGGGPVPPPDPPPNGGKPAPEPVSPAPSLSALDLDELSRLLAALAEGLRPDHKAALDDFFLDGLSYEEISRKRGWPIGTIGTYIQRGLAAMRQPREKHSKLLKEAAAFLRLLLW
jgi:DNA-directed RNA polymerase specialized sigma24 family protein